MLLTGGLYSGHGYGDSGMALLCEKNGCIGTFWAEEALRMGQAAAFEAWDAAQWAKRKASWVPPPPDDDPLPPEAA
jgi:hypothetical protein